MSGAQPSLTHEREIEWQEDIRHMDYVREATVATSTRTGPVPTPPGAERRCGYAIHERPSDPSPTEQVVERRVFYLMPGDRDASDFSGDPDDVYATWCPCEAVDPRTVKPGKPGEITARVRPLAGDGGGEVEEGL